MAATILKAGTALSLGLPNLFRVFWYRAGLKTGCHPVCQAQALLPADPFFRPFPEECAFQNDGADEKLLYFGRHQVPAGDTPPDWHLNPMTGRRATHSDRPWWKIPDFDPLLGDIKGVWEASRFDWVMDFARRAASGRLQSEARLNYWLADWCRQNPAYCGVNWKCGQEASIRVMHLAMAALMLDQHRTPEPALMSLVEAHLKRIAPTVSYAVAQDNNHGTSEAAALFMGGAWLAASGKRVGKCWQRLGRKLLENRAARLIASDGSFSQYSANYHRVLLDTLSMVELWRRRMDLPDFTPRFQDRCRAAARWLAAMTDRTSGRVPNLGSNDGAFLLPMTAGGYSDFRPSVSLAFALFLNAGFTDDPGSGALLDWLKISPLAKTLAVSKTALFPEGGYVLLEGKSSWGMVRAANFRFRPSHADCLHLDLWRGGENILRDGGTFSYNADPAFLQYFPGTASHNTVQFDDRDQMPRLGRFLFGAWLKMKAFSGLVQNGDSMSWTGAYTDFRKAHHRRTVTVTGDEWRIRDEISGYRTKAVLRWRLPPGDWTLSGTGCRSDKVEIDVRANAPIRRTEIVSGWESLYYQEKSEIPVLEVEVGPGQWNLETSIRLMD